VDAVGIDLDADPGAHGGMVCGLDKPFEAPEIQYFWGFSFAKNQKNTANFQ